MWTSGALLRFFAMLACVSVGLLLHDVSAQTTQMQPLLSALPERLGECPWGQTRVDGRCLPIRIPEHGFLDASGKYWECERGYKRAGNRCVTVHVPAHAFLNYSGDDWECERGYTRRGDTCVRLKLPRNAHLDYTGHAWECNPGYQRVEHTCQAVWARFARPGDAILAAMPTSEVKEVVRKMQHLLQQAGYDPGPIDGVLGPQTLAALQRYLESSEHTLVQDTPSRRHPRKEKEG